MNRVRKLLAVHWQTIITVVLAVGGLGFLLFWQIGSITNFRLSPMEADTVISASSLRAIIDNSLYLPLKVLTYLLNLLPIDVVFLRSAASLIGVLTAFYFYFILRALHTRRITAIAITLFVTSSWFLQSVRVITPVVMVLYSTTALIFLSLWLPHAKHKKLAFVFAATVAASLVYTPGFLLLLLVLVAIKPKKFTVVLKGVPTWLIVISGAMFVVMIAPLVYSLVFGDLSVRTYLGIPLVFEPIEWAKRLLVIPAYLFARGPLEPVFNVGRLPVLDIFTTILAILGAYSYYYQRKLSRTGLLVILAIFGIIMITLNGSLWLPLLMPIVYILAAMGITLLLQQWFTVFPRNPLARGIGVTVLCLALATVSVYHLNRYFEAWPNAPATKAIFTKSDVQ